MRVLLLLLAMGRASLAGATPLERSALERGLLSRGSVLEERGDYGQARALYALGQRQFPRSGEIALRLGTIALRSGEWPDAITWLEEAQRLRPRHVDTLYYLAQAYYLDGRHEPARTAIGRAAALAPARADVAQKHGEYLCEADQCKQGLRHLLRARRLDPALPAIDFDLGMAYHKQAALPEARRHLEEAVKKDPDNLVAARFLADVMGREELWEPARGLYQRVVDREPSNAWALYGLGRALIGLGRYEAALAPLRESLAALPTMAEAHFQLGQALRQLGRGDEAQRELALFSALRDRASGSAGPLSRERTPVEGRIWEAVQGLVAEGKEAEALAFLDAQPRTTGPSSHYLLGVLYLSLQRSGDAVRMLTQAAAAAPDDADVLASLGRAHVAEGREQDAQRVLTQALARQPKGELPLIGMGELEYARRHWLDAIRYFEESRTSQVPVLLKLCRSYVLVNDVARARQSAELVRAFAARDPASLREVDAILALLAESAPPASPAP